MRKSQYWVGGLTLASIVGYVIFIITHSTSHSTYSENHPHTFVAAAQGFVMILGLGLSALGTEFIYFKVSIFFKEKMNITLKGGKDK